MKDHVFDILDALHAPLLTFSTSWADSIPQRVKEIIPLARMKALMQGEEKATYAECVAYLITRSHEAPMDYEWTDIYCHVSCTVCQEYFNEDHWNEVRAPRELSSWLMSQLNQLRVHLYEKRRKLLKEQLKQERKCQTPSTEVGTKPTTPAKVLEMPASGEPRSMNG